jgi:hypothetical protein
MKSAIALLIWFGLVPSVLAQVGQALKSPDGTLRAVVKPARNQNVDESRVSILDSGGKQLRTHDFSSSNGDHGYRVDGAQWTPDSQFFVFRMRSSGGHSPMYAPLVFWSRKTNRFYQVNNYTADQTFSIRSPEEVSVNTWPDMKPVTVSLGALPRAEFNELR